MSTYNLDDSFSSSSKEIESIEFLQDDLEEIRGSNYSNISEIYIFIHGIRSSSSSFDGCREVVQSHLIDAGINKKVELVVVRYERISAFRALFCKNFSKAENFVSCQITNIIEKYTNEKLKVNIIAHSFGSRIFSRICGDLNTHFEKIIFLGSVSRDSLSVSVEKSCNIFLNICGARDYIVLLAYILRGNFYSYNGYFGFRTGTIIDAFYEANHGMLIDKEFFRLHIIPIILKDSIIKSNGRKRIKETSVINIRRFLIILVFAALPLILIMFLLWE
ncbi:hypothetical protein LC092_16825 [Stappia stellulata]|uniref:hypothetical protein n=1 Tax=Stappia stellulata TaxID=71235 RepID=UPI001CD227DD|nr:hypothetical protein [Stappia stellulata]MCA1244110.1 hypothetical protein [Stappia stellulata]